MADHLSSVPSKAETERMVREASMAIQRGDIAAAESIAVRAIDAGSEHPFLLKVKALALHNRGEFRDALRAFHHARLADPNDPSTLNGIAGCLAAIGEYRAAIEMVEASLALAPEAQPTHYLRGWILQQAGELQSARSAYGRALTFSPNDPTVQAALASVSAGLEDFDAARARAHQALASDPRQVTAMLALAEADIAQGKAKDMEPRLRGMLLQSSLPPANRAQVQTALGDVLDALNRPADAFAVWSEKAQRTRAVADPTAAFAERFAMTTDEDWQSPAAEGPRPAPAFVTGAGAEIMVRVLSALPTVLRAHGSLNELAYDHLRSPDGITELAKLKAAELDELRQTYWNRLNSAEDSPAIVEQSVRYPIDLPLIAKLFPGAKVLLHVRDPRDAVLETFRHQAGSDSSGTGGFTLEECARAYTAVLDFAEACRTRLPLHVHDVRHELLVSDYETGVKDALDFLGLDLPAELPPMHHREKRSTGFWRRYKEQMAPVLPMLAPWVEKLGYPAE